MGARRNTHDKQLAKTFTCEPLGSKAMFSQRENRHIRNSLHAIFRRSRTPPTPLAKYRPLRDAAEFFHPICLALVSEQLTLLQTEGKHVKVGVIVSLA